MERLVWKAVPGYDGYYEVSNTGQVRSVEHYVNTLKGSRRLIKPSIKKQRDVGHGYKSVSFCVNGESKTKLVHRLVAQTFIPNPNNLPQVNHIDGDIGNNNVSNLEWVTDDENKLHSSIQNGGTQRPKRKVNVVEISTGKVFVFEGLREAERKMNLDHKSALNVIKGRCKHTKGYSISYA